MHTAAYERSALAPTCQPQLRTSHMYRHPTESGGYFAVFESEETECGSADRKQNRDLFPICSSQWYRKSRTPSRFLTARILRVQESSLVPPLSVRILRQRSKHPHPCCQKALRHLHRQSLQCARLRLRRVPHQNLTSLRPWRPQRQLLPQWPL